MWGSASRMGVGGGELRTSTDGAVGGTVRRKGWEREGRRGEEAGGKAVGGMGTPAAVCGCGQARRPGIRVGDGRHGAGGGRRRSLGSGTRAWEADNLLPSCRSASPSGTRTEGRRGWRPAEWCSRRVHRDAQPVQPRPPRARARKGMLGRSSAPARPGLHARVHHAQHRPPAGPPAPRARGGKPHTPAPLHARVHGSPQPSRHPAAAEPRTPARPHANQSPIRRVRVKAPAPPPTHSPTAARPYPPRRGTTGAG